MPRPRRDIEPPYDPARAREVRRRLGITQTQLAALLRLPDHRALQHWERGRGAIAGATRAIYEALEMALSRNPPARVWGPPELTSPQRLMRIFVHAYQDPAASPAR